MQKFFFFHFPKTSGKYFTDIRNTHLKITSLNCSIRSKIISPKDLNKIFFKNYTFYRSHLHPCYFKIIKKLKFQTMTIIRHPLSFLTSYYVYIKNRKVKKKLNYLKNKSFDEFINDDKVMGLFKKHFKDPSNFDWFGVYEHFDLTKKSFCNFININENQLSNKEKNLSPEINLKNSLEDNYSEIINNLYKDEIKIYEKYLKIFLKKNENKIF